MAWSFLLLVLATACGVVALMRLMVRFGYRWFFLGKLCAGLAASLAVFLIAVSFADDLFGDAKGNQGWASNGLLRAGLILALTVLVGLYVFFAYRDRHPDNG